jgi:hypothetical protein
MCCHIVVLISFVPLSVLRGNTVLEVKTSLSVLHVHGLEVTCILDGNVKGMLE